MLWFWDQNLRSKVKVRVDRLEFALYRVALSFFYYPFILVRSVDQARFLSVCDSTLNNFAI